MSSFEMHDIADDVWDKEETQPRCIDCGRFLSWAVIRYQCALCEKKHIPFDRKEPTP